MAESCPRLRRRCKRLRGRAHTACLDRYRAQCGGLGRRPTPKADIINEAGVDAETFATAREGIAKWLASMDKLEAAPKGSAVRGIRARYRLILEEKRAYSCEETFKFRVEPIGAHSVMKPRPWSTHLLFRKPKDAIDEIESLQAPDLAYRGMNWSEWRAARERGFVQSRGGYNLGPEQENLTFFSPDIRVAHSYASGFAPIQHKAAKRRPAVIVAVPKKLLLTPRDRPGAIPGGELAANTPISLADVKRAWMLVPTEARSGMMELRRDVCVKEPQWREGSRSSPSIYTALVKMPKSARF